MAVDEGFKGRGHGQCEPCTKWGIVRKAVQQHRILRCFHTLRHMSDGLLLDFDKLQYVCTLGEGAYGAVEKRRLVAADGTQSVYAVKHLKNSASILEMGGMDKDTLTRTLERVSSLITDDAREGSAQPASSLSELPEIQSVAYVPRLLPVALWRVGDISTVNMHPFYVAIIDIFCSVSTVKAHKSVVEADQRLIDEVWSAVSHCINAAAPDELSEADCAPVSTPESCDAPCDPPCDAPNTHSGLLGLPLPPKPVSQSEISLEQRHHYAAPDSDARIIEPLKVASGASSSASRRASSKPGGSDVDRIVARMSAVRNPSSEDRVFMAELHVMRKLSHPYIARYLGCGFVTERGPPGAPARQYISIAQECCEGGSIAKLVRRATVRVGKKRLYSYHDAWRWSLQLAKALQYMHDSSPRVLHRDLKSDNVLLSKPGRAGDIRIVDFGLTKLCKDLPTGSGLRRKTRERYVMSGQAGSYLHMAPEVTRFEPYNVKVDIFSLGVIMYELFTMCPIVARMSEVPPGPVNVDPHEKEAFAHRVADGFRLELKPSWPPSLQEIITRCWHADPEVRPHGEQLVHMLARIEGEVVAMDERCKRGVVDVDHDARKASKTAPFSAAPFPAASFAAPQKQSACCVIC